MFVFLTSGQLKLLCAALTRLVVSFFKDRPCIYRGAERRDASSGIDPQALSRTTVISSAATNKESSSR